MSVGAICFTSSGSTGGCLVVLVCSSPFFWKRGFFFPYTTCTKKKVSVTYTKKKFCRKKNVIYAYFHNRATLSLEGVGQPTSPGGQFTPPPQKYHLAKAWWGH